MGVMGRGIQSSAEKRHVFSSPTVYGSPFYRCVLLLLWVATCHPLESLCINEKTLTISCRGSSSVPPSPTPKCWTKLLC